VRAALDPAELSAVVSTGAGLDRAGFMRIAAEAAASTPPPPVL
jgi:hypothetical protein